MAFGSYKSGIRGWPDLKQMSACVIVETDRESQTMPFCAKRHIFPVTAALALSLADRAYVMEGGRIVAQGTSAEIAADGALAEAYLGGAAAS